MKQIFIGFGSLCLLSASVVIHFPVYLFSLLLGGSQYGKQVLSAGVVVIVALILFKNSFIFYAYLFLGDFESISGVLKFYFGSDYITLGIALSFLVLIVKYKPHFYQLLIIMLLIVVVYFIYGIFTSSIIPALSYFRSYTIPIFAITIGSYLGSKNVRLIRLLLPIYLAFLIYLLLENFVPDFYQLLNVDKYLDLKYNNPNASNDSEFSFMERMGTTVMGVTFQRLLGPQFHPMSVGYSICGVMLLLCVGIKKTISTQIFFMPIFLVLLICVAFMSSKGAFLVGLAILSSYYFIKNNTYLVSSLILYNLIMLTVASFPLTSAYDHLKGLLGGISYFTTNPLGHGIGHGGNMSGAYGVQEYGSESFIGVALVHLGVMAFVYYYILLKIIVKGLLYGDEKLKLVAVFILFLLSNSLLQEEAMSPSAAFLPFLLFGYLYSKNYNKACTYAGYLYPNYRVEKVCHNV